MTNYILPVIDPQPYPCPTSKRPLLAPSSPHPPKATKKASHENQ